MGFTDLITLTPADLSDANVGGNQTVNAIPLDLGDFIGNEMLVERPVEFDQATLTMEIGVTGTTNRFAPTAFDLSAAVYAATEAAVAPHVAIAASTFLTVSFFADAGWALADLTTGEVRVWVRIHRRAERNVQA